MIYSLSINIEENVKMSRRSMGERTIYNWLKTNNIEFESEKRFSDCRNIRPLPFDFYLLDHNVLIEFDGKQHFKPFWFGHFTTPDFRTKMKLQFTKIQYHDSIKNDYCLNKNIELIRIPYWELENINDILRDKLIK